MSLSWEVLRQGEFRTYVVQSQGQALVIDACNLAATYQYLSRKKLKPKLFIWTHYPKHKIDFLKLRKCTVYGPVNLFKKYPEMKLMSRPSKFKFGGYTWQIFANNNWAPQHMMLYCPQKKVLFGGDIILNHGIGHNFAKSDAKSIYDVIQKVKRLPGQTQLMCSYERSLKHIRFCIEKIAPQKKWVGPKSWIHETTDWKHFYKTEISRAREDLKEFGHLAATLELEKLINPYLVAKNFNVFSDILACRGWPKESKHND